MWELEQQGAALAPVCAQESGKETTDLSKARYLRCGSTGTGSLQVKLTFAEEAAGRGRDLPREEAAVRSAHPAWLLAVTELIRFIPCLSSHSLLFV